MVILVKNFHFGFQKTLSSMLSSPICPGRQEDTSQHHSHQLPYQTFTKPGLCNMKACYLHKAYSILDALY